VKFKYFEKFTRIGSNNQGKDSEDYLRSHILITDWLLAAESIGG